MPKICYVPKKFKAASQLILDRANMILDENQRKGYSMTLRGLYYQFVARDLFPQKYSKNSDGKWVKDDNGTINADPNYGMLQDLISAGRLAGQIDWLAIVDRMRGVERNSHWEKPSEAVKSIAAQYATDKWANQPHYVEVWIEKDALGGVIAPACSDLDVPFLACRGYGSQTVTWDAAQRLLSKSALGKQVHIIHLGDHDPSGIDMSRDIKERLELFCGDRVHVQRVALNMAQVQKYNPPPNYAKETDARYPAYQEKFGDLCWELDALTPEVLVDITHRAVMQYRDEALWDEAVKLQERGRGTLNSIVEDFPTVRQFLRDKKGMEKNK
jgi:hypothetical protein